MSIQQVSQVSILSNSANPISENSAKKVKSALSRLSNLSVIKTDSDHLEAVSAARESFISMRATSQSNYLAKALPAEISQLMQENTVELASVIERLTSAAQVLEEFNAQEMQGTTPGKEQKEKARLEFTDALITLEDCIIKMETFEQQLTSKVKSQQSSGFIPTLSSLPVRSYAFAATCASLFLHSAAAALEPVPGNKKGIDYGSWENFFLALDTWMRGWGINLSGAALKEVYWALSDNSFEKGSNATLAQSFGGQIGDIISSAINKIPSGLFTIENVKEILNHIGAGISAWLSSAEGKEFASNLEQPAKDLINHAEKKGEELILYGYESALWMSALVPIIAIITSIITLRLALAADRELYGTDLFHGIGESLSRGFIAGAEGYKGLATFLEKLASYATKGATNQLIDSTNERIEDVSDLTTVLASYAGHGLFISADENKEIITELTQVVAKTLIDEGFALAQKLGLDKISDALGKVAENFKEWTLPSDHITLKITMEDLIDSVKNPIEIPTNLSEADRSELAKQKEKVLVMLYGDESTSLSPAEVQDLKKIASCTAKNADSQKTKPQLPTKDKIADAVIYTMLMKAHARGLRDPLWKYVKEGKIYAAPNFEINNPLAQFIGRAAFMVGKGMVDSGGGRDIGTAMYQGVRDDLPSATTVAATATTLATCAWYAGAIGNPIFGGVAMIAAVASTPAARKTFTTQVANAFSSVAKHVSNKIKGKEPIRDAPIEEENTSDDEFYEAEEAISVPPVTNAATNGSRQATISQDITASEAAPSPRTSAPSLSVRQNKSSTLRAKIVAKRQQPLREITRSDNHTTIIINRTDDSDDD